MSASPHFCHALALTPFRQAVDQCTTIIGVMVAALLACGWFSSGQASAASSTEIGLKPPRTFRTGAYSSFVTESDLNGDGETDLIVVNLDSVSILLGNGDGTFAPAIN